METLLELMMIKNAIEDKTNVILNEKTERHLAMASLNLFRAPFRFLAKVWQAYCDFVESTYSRDNCNARKTAYDHIHVRGIY